MTSEEQNLDRVRQILKRMERSIDDARVRRLREDGHSPASNGDHASNNEHRAASSTPSNQPASPNTTQQPAQPAGPVRFDEDGRPIVGRAKPKNSSSSPQGNTPYSPGSSSWR